uniref:Helitron helicase n=1 Tax=Ascaris lumbricoides TaxID=6252 RepID=A0A0M3IX57_ASCLU
MKMFNAHVRCSSGPVDGQGAIVFFITNVPCEDMSTKLYDVIINQRSIVDELYQTGYLLYMYYLPNAPAGSAITEPNTSRDSSSTTPTTDDHPAANSTPNKPPPATETTQNPPLFTGSAQNQSTITGPAQSPPQVSGPETDQPTGTDSAQKPLRVAKLIIQKEGMTM